MTAQWKSAVWQSNERDNKGKWQDQYMAIGGGHQSRAGVL